jgi:hypothetical protein
MGATEIYVLALIATALPFKRRFAGLPDYVMRLTDVLWRTLGNVGYLTTRIEKDGTYRGVPIVAVHPSEELSGFRAHRLFSTTAARSRRLITAGYRDANRELARRRRRAAARPSGEAGGLEVEPAFRHEVA